MSDGVTERRRDGETECEEREGGRGGARRDREGQRGTERQRQRRDREAETETETVRETYVHELTQVQPLPQPHEPWPQATRPCECPRASAHALAASPRRQSPQTCGLERVQGGISADLCARASVRIVAKAVARAVARASTWTPCCERVKHRIVVQNRIVAETRTRARSRTRSRTRKHMDALLRV